MHGVEVCTVRGPEQCEEAGAAREQRERRDHRGGAPAVLSEDETAEEHGNERDDASDLWHTRRTETQQVHRE